MATMATPLLEVVGAKTGRILSRQLDLHTVGDLLRHYPRRYLERAEQTDLDALAVGEKVTVSATVQRVESRWTNGRPAKKILHVTIGDDRGARLRLTFFHRTYVFERDLAPGRRGIFTGEVSLFKGHRQLTHPEYLMIDGPNTEAGAEKEFMETLIGVYPLTKDLSLFSMRNAVKDVLDKLEPVEDSLPDELRARRRLPTLTRALHDIHRPRGWPALGAAQKRLKWDEAMVLQVTLAQRRRLLGLDPGTPRPPVPGGLAADFEERLPFELTEGQRAIGAELAEALAGSHPMHRLLQGEVGSGKTIVALRAMLQVVDAGGQAALLAPTEVLAAQHARNLRELLGPLGRRGELDFSGALTEHATRVALLTGSMPTAARRKALLDAASGEAGIVIGTHALIQDNVSFADLGLVVIDEQHRFGVEQRDALRAKGKRPPHVLVMTATPIPRTVAMTVFGDLETCSLRELPKGRSPISTTVIPAAEKPGWLDRAWQRITEEVAKGHQAFVVCPRIGGPADESDVDGSAVLSEVDEDGVEEVDRRPPVSVNETLPLLAEGPLHGLRVAALHGRMPPEEKDAVMGAFAAGELDVLVATTVIEVGVDVPNATVMVVLDADRFGVSQLHQLRGRIGRGSAPGLCLLVTESPADTKARERLAAVASTVDGFELARLDLEQRREGDVLGAAQWGRRSSLRLLSLLRDEDLITDARTEATALVDADPDLLTHPVLAAEIAKLTEDRAEYLEKT
jgi:ATP-dependent DNA helicase RecG